MSAAPGVPQASHRPTFYFAPQPWMARAACAQPNVDPDWFFVESGRCWEAEMAESLCRRCPVKSECLEYALETEQKWGRWGERHKTEIKKLIKQRNEAKPKPLPPIEHGTDRGAKAHWKRKETPCPSCMAATRLERQLRRERTTA